MSTQSDSLAQNIIDWYQKDDIPCINESANNPKLTWILKVGKSIVIYKRPKFDDRIFIQSQIKLSAQHRTLVNQTWDANQRNNMMFNLKKLVAQYDVNMDFQMNSDELLGFNTSKTHFYSTISKADLFEKFFRVQNIHEVILNQLNIELGIALQSSHKNQSSDNTGR